MPPFDSNDLKGDILRYVYFDMNESKHNDTDKKRLETIVRKFCPKLQSDHPQRIEKLLNILDLKDALKLYMI